MTDRDGLAVVTGGSRGIGRELVRQLAASGMTVVLGARTPESLEGPVGDAGGRILVRRLDVTSPTDAAELADELASAYGRLDVLVNNAAIHYDTGQDAATADLTIVEEAVATNLVGAWRTTVALLPLLGAGSRVVNVSSGAGSFAETAGGGSVPVYSVTKAALDMLTVKLAAAVRGRGVLVNAVCPGWVATDMGGRGGRPVAEGAASVLYAVDLPPDGPTGRFFRDGREIEW